MILEQPGSPEEFLNAVYTHFEISYPKFHKMDQLCKLGILAAELLLKDSGHSDKYGETETGLVLSNANASLDVDLKYAKTIQTGASPALFVYTLPNIVIGEISIRWHFKGENAFFVFKQFDATFMAQYVNNLFFTNVIQACVCGWLELMGEDYKAVLLLVEKQKTTQSLDFTEDNINKIYRVDNG